MLDWLNSAVALGIVVKLVTTADSMNGTTRHRFRFAVAMLAIAALAFALWPVYGEWPEYMDTVLICAVCCYVFCDQRKRRETTRAHGEQQIRLAP